MGFRLFRKRDLNGEEHAIPLAKPGQCVPLSATDAVHISSVFGSDLVRFVSNVDCHVEIDISASATIADTYLPANVVEYFPVAESSELVSVTKAATAVNGTLYLTPME